MTRLFKTFCKQIHEGVISHLPTVSPHRRKHASNQGREACTVRARCNIYLFIFQYFRVNCPFNGWAYGGILENIVLLNLWHQPFSFFNMTTPQSTNPCAQRHDIWMTCLAISYNWWLKLKCPHTLAVYNNVYLETRSPSLRAFSWSVVWSPCSSSCCAEMCESSRGSPTDGSSTTSGGSYWGPLSSSLHDYCLYMMEEMEAKC